MAVFRFRPGRFPISAKAFSDFGLEFGGQNRGRKLTKNRGRKLTTVAQNASGLAIWAPRHQICLADFRHKTVAVLDSDFSFRQKMKGFARKFGKAPRENWEGFPKKIANASVASDGRSPRPMGAIQFHFFLVGNRPRFWPKSDQNFGRNLTKTLAENRPKSWSKIGQDVCRKTATRLLQTHF